MPHDRYKPWEIRNSNLVRGVSGKRTSNRERQRLAQRAIYDGKRAYLVLLAALAQKGGELEVTTGTIDQVGEALEFLDFEITSNVNDPRSKIIRLTDSRKKTEPTPKSQVSIRTITDDEENRAEAAPATD